MSPIAICILALSMSVDSFIASVAKGAALPNPNFGHAIRTGCIFGGVQALTPIMGWCAGMAASRYFVAVNHWVAFALLCAVGFYMIVQGCGDEVDESFSSTCLGATILAAIATSLDAMAVGVSLAFLEVNILVIAGVIGVTTIVISSTGVLAGRVLGERLGRYAAICGGVALVGLGFFILHEHMIV